MFLRIWSKPYKDRFCILVNLLHLTDLIATLRNVWLIYTNKVVRPEEADLGRRRLKEHWHYLKQYETAVENFETFDNYQESLTWRRYIDHLPDGISPEKSWPILKSEVSESPMEILGHLQPFPTANDWSSSIWITPSIRYSFVFQRIRPVHNMYQTKNRTVFLPRQNFYHPERGLGRQILILIWL